MEKLEEKLRRELHQNDNDDDDKWVKKNLTLIKRSLVEAIAAETKQEEDEVIEVWNGIAAVVAEEMK
eukprot:9500135-Heterocapsa_arctica.AAC.1